MSDQAVRDGAEAMEFVDEHSRMQVAMEIARLRRENAEMRDAYDRDSEHVMEDET